MSQGMMMMKRRATPVPVAPPRIPTPMPINNNNNVTTRSSHAGNNKDQSGNSGSNMKIQPPSVGPDIPKLITKQATYKLLDNDVKTAWINPRLISKIDLELIRTTEYTLPEPNNPNHRKTHHHHNNGHHHQRLQVPPSSSSSPATRRSGSEWEQSHHHQHHQGPTYSTTDDTTPLSVNGGVGRPLQHPPPARTSVVVSQSSPSVAATAAAAAALHHQDARQRIGKKVVGGGGVKPPPIAMDEASSSLPVPLAYYNSGHHNFNNNNVGGGGGKSGGARVTKTARMSGKVGYHQSSACYLGAGVGVYREAKYTFEVNAVGSCAQASAAAAFFARAAQKLNLSSSPHRRKRHNSEEGESASGGASGFCGALQRSPPPVPPALLRRIGVREVTGVGKVKVMLRVSSPSSTGAESTNNSFFSLDKRKKQVNLVDPGGSSSLAAPSPEDRRVGVAAPKMFAFDAIFSQDDSQSEVCSSALTDVIHAVINGNDGCLFCFGHAGLGKTFTMLGSPESGNTLGIIPCAISWLFKGINEQKQKTGARFSVRVSAVEVCGPTNQMHDLLAGYACDSEQSPGVYLRDDPLFGSQPSHCELRVPTAERAAHYLDAALECRTREDAVRDSHFLFTLHVYQYSVAGKGGVAGGRSRLHLIDLGNSERGKASGGIPLSGLGNILLAIFNNQKHLPYKEHKLPHLLRDCLGSLTCHAAMIAHVSPSAQHYTDTLTTVQLASRIHRMRRRRCKFTTHSTSTGSGGGSSGEEPTRSQGTSSEPDPSSSDLSADTVIYVGPSVDDATDGEHPPVYIPSLNSGDNRCSMSKALRGSSAEHHPKSPYHRPSVVKNPCQSNKTSPKSSPKSHPKKNESNSSPKHSNSDEQWIDGPRISKSKVAEARHLLKEACHVKKRETWIDGPQVQEAYGYMDSHKKNMIRKWVEHQTFQLQKTVVSVKKDPKLKELTQFKTAQPQKSVEESTIRTGLKLVKTSCSIPECSDPIVEEAKEEDDEEVVEIPPALPLIQPLSSREVSLESLDILLKERMLSNAEYYSNCQDDDLEDESHHPRDEEEEEDEILEIIEVEEPLEPVPMQDSCLQVTEEDIALCMGYIENPLPEVDQENPLDHPLRILSQENLTVVSTFTDSMSIYHDLERILPRHRYDPNYYADDYEDPDNPPKNPTEQKLDQLARLHQLYSNKLARANVANSETYQQQKTLSRCESLTLNEMLYGEAQDNGSIYSEPAYIQEKFCENCKINMTRPNNTWSYDLADLYLSASTQDLRKMEQQQQISGRFQRYCHNYDHHLAYLRHPDGASNPNLVGENFRSSRVDCASTSEAAVPPLPPPNSLPSVERINRGVLNIESCVTPVKLMQKCEGYDSGHDSTPRTSKHSPAAISRRAESGYDSVVRDSESSSIDSDISRSHRLRQQQQQRRGKCNSKHKHEKSFCSWFLNPFTCKYIDDPPETHF